MTQTPGSSSEYDLPPSERPSFLLGAAPVRLHLDTLNTLLHDIGDPTGQRTMAVNAIAARLSLLEDICADAYQFCGSNDAPVPLLDNLSMAAVGRTIPHPAIMGLYPDRLQILKQQLAEQAHHLKVIQPLLRILQTLLSTVHSSESASLNKTLTTLLTSTKDQECPHEH